MHTNTPTIVLDSLGAQVAVSDGILYLLTGCCQASAKGSTNSPTGVACRACYAALPTWAGWAALVDDQGAAESLARLLATAWGAPGDALGRVPTRVARETLAKARAL